MRRGPERAEEAEPAETGFNAELADRLRGPKRAE